MSSKTVPQAQPQDFEDVLVTLDRGQLIQDAEVALQEVVDAVRTTGKKGSITLKIDIAPASRGSVDTLFFKGKVDSSKPLPERQPSIFYADDENLVYRQDPNQFEMDLKPAPEPDPAPLRKLGSKAS